VQKETFPPVTGTAGNVLIVKVATGVSSVQAKPGAVMIALNNISFIYSSTSALVTVKVAVLSLPSATSASVKVTPSVL